MKTTPQFLSTFIIVAMLWSALLTAQPYCNEWIQHSQLYAKFKVARNAWYQIPYAALQNAGFPAESAGFQVFCKGEQIPIWVSANGAMTQNDYLLFYATANNGSFDTQLYADPDWQASAQLSLFTDSISYFITYNTLAPNKRYTPTANNLSSPPTPEPFFMHKEQKVFKNIFNQGKPVRVGVNINLPFYEEAEGWSSVQISGNTPNGWSTILPTPHLYIQAGAPLPLFQTVVVGLNNDFGALPTHPFTINIGGMPYVYDNFEGYSLKRVQSSVLPTHIGQPHTEIKCLPQSSGNNIAVAEVALTYPRLFDADSLPLFAFTLPDNNARYVEIAHFNGGANPMLADLSNGLMLTPIPQGNHYRIMLPPVPEATGQRQLILFNATAVCPYNCQTPVCTPANCTVYQVPELTPVTFTNFLQPNQQGNYLIITHPSLQQTDTNWVAQYAAYRATPQGGAHTPQIVNIEELYDQFAYGIAKHPLAIRHFVNFAIDHFDLAPQYVFLVGKGVSYRQALHANFNAQCLVPTFGQNPSDNLLVSRNAQNWLPQLPIGRLSASNPDEVRRFYEKIVAYETPKPCTWNNRWWTKNSIGLTGAVSGDGDAMLALLQKHNQIFDTVACNLLPLTIIPNNLNAGAELTEAINNGAMLIDYIGEAGGSYFAAPLAAPEAYANEGKLPLLLANTSYAGNVFDIVNTSATMPPPSMNILLAYNFAEGKGAIGGISPVGIKTFTFVNALYKLALKNVLHTYKDQPLGYALHRAIADKYIQNPTTANEILVNYATTAIHYEGDPALQFAASYTHPEFTLFNTQELPDVQVINPATAQPYPAADTITLQTNTLLLHIGVGNLGAQSAQPLPLLVQQTNSAGVVVQTDIFYLNIQEVQNQFALTLPIFTGAAPDTLQISLQLNPDEALIEDCYHNNHTTITALVSEDLVINATMQQPPALLIYPNPVLQTLHISGIMQPGSAALYNNLGQLVLTQPLLPNEVNTLPTEPLAAGVYYLQISQPHAIVGQKVVKW